MSLRLRIGSILVLALIVQAMLTYLIQQSVLMPSYEALEAVKAQEDIERCREALNRELFHLDLFNHDWSSWDAAYEFAQDRNQEFIASNLDLKWFRENRLSLMSYLDLSGRVVWQRVFSVEDDVEIELPEIPSQQWSLDHPLLRLPARGTPCVASFYATSKGVMLVSSRPVLDSAEVCPSRGYLLMGRLLDEKTLEGLRIQTRVDFHVELLAAPWITPKAKRALDHLEEAGPYHLQPRDDTILEAQTLLKTSWGDPILLVSANLPRDVTQRGTKTLSSQLYLSAAAALFTVLLILILLRRVVIAPVHHLTRHVEVVESTNDLVTFPEADRNDEIGRLASGFNHMVRRVQRDNALREQAQVALLESENRVRAILEAAPDAILTVGDDGRVQSFNSAAVRTFGYAREEIMGQPAALLMPTLHTGEGVAPLMRRLFGGDNSVVDLGDKEEGWRKDGSTFPIHLTVGEMLLDGKPVFTEIVRDITALREMHNQLARSRHLAMLGEMAASIAHEVRNPLAGISGAIQVIRDGFPQDDPRRGVVLQMLHEIARINRIVEQLQLFSRPWSLERAPHHLARIIDDVTEKIQIELPSGNVKIVKSDSLDCTVQVDIFLFQQVLWNVITNALHAMPDGGELVFHVLRDDGMTRVCICDTGEGIHPDILQRVLEPFVTTKTYGTGLGLSISRRIMEEHGGRIEIEPGKVRGTCVRLILPGGVLHE